MRIHQSKRTYTSSRDGELDHWCNDLSNVYWLIVCQPVPFFASPPWQKFLIPLTSTYVNYITSLGSFYCFGRRHQIPICVGIGADCIYRNTVVDSSSTSTVVG